MNTPLAEHQEYRTLTVPVVNKGEEGKRVDSYKYLGPIKLIIGIMAVPTIEITEVRTSVIFSSSRCLKPLPHIPMWVLPSSRCLKPLPHIPMWVLPSSRCLKPLPHIPMWVLPNSWCLKPLPHIPMWVLPNSWCLKPLPHIPKWVRPIYPVGGPDDITSPSCPVDARVDSLPQCPSSPVGPPLDSCSQCPSSREAVVQWNSALVFG
ncbi:hypothetical protein NQZ68_033411 [Dissostichus eleginoides]|nr:hypothetical protein NQZ68_033411 [Dissostichus eleginoides]